MGGWKEHARLILANQELDDRGKRYALCRNVLLADAKTLLPPTGLLLMLDPECRIDETSVLLAKMAELQLKREVDMIAANNPGAYRDLWALRAEDTKWVCQVWVRQRADPSRTYMDSPDAQ